MKTTALIFTILLGLATTPVNAQRRGGAAPMPHPRTSGQNRGLHEGDTRGRHLGWTLGKRDHGESRSDKAQPRKEKPKDKSAGKSKR